jgi:hypothetical protein
VNTKDRDALRLMGYSVSAAGHIECAKGATEYSYQKREPGSLRFEQEHVAVVKIDGSKEVVEQLVAAADSPRALTGKNRGGAVLVFRREKNQDIKPSDLAYQGRDVFELMHKDTHERLTLTIKSEGMTLDAGSYSWGKRSPLDTSRDSLPVLTHDLSELVINAAFAAGSTWASIVEQDRANEQRLEQTRADIAAGRVKLHESDAERLEREDGETVAATAGREYVASDGIAAQLIIAARARFARRKKPAADAA